MESILQAIRTRGDYLSSLTFKDSYITREAQAAYAELYELIALTHEGWWDKSSTVSTVAAQNYVALPEDCWRVQAVDILCGSEWRSLTQVGLKDRNRYQASTAQPEAYRLSARGAELFPTPNAIYTLRVSYTPIVGSIDDTNLQQFGWDEYVIVGALLRLDQRSEKPIGERQQELERCKLRIIAAANERKSSEPELLNLHMHDDDFDGYNPGSY